MSGGDPWVRMRKWMARRTPTYLTESEKKVRINNSDALSEAVRFADMTFLF